MIKHRNKILNGIENNIEIDLLKCFEYEITKSVNEQNICPFCNIHKKLYKLPPYLIIYINWENENSNCNFKFTEKINLDKYSISKNDTNYELYALIIKFKNQYNAYVKNFIAKEWYYYYDKTTFEQKNFFINELYQNKMTHLLFYKNATNDY